MSDSQPVTANEHLPTVITYLRRQQAKVELEIHRNPHPDSKELRRKLAASFQFAADTLAALSPAPQVPQETVQQKVPLGGEARKWVETYLAGLRQSLERIEKDRSEYELEPLQGFIARAAEGNRWVIAALEAALSAPPPAQQKDGEQQ